MHRSITTSRSRRRVTTSVLKDQFLIVTADDATHVVLAAVPGALVHRLFLTPDDMLEVFVRAQDFDQVVFRERVQLLNTHNGDVITTFGTAFFQEVVVDLAAAQ